MASTTERPQHTSVQAYEEATMEQGVEDKRPIVSADAVHDQNETRPAGSTRWGEAILGVSIALLPLYFAGFAIEAFVRDGTLASSFRNVAILQMSKFVCRRQKLALKTLATTLTTLLESDDISDLVHSDLREIHQSSRQLEA